MTPDQFVAKWSAAELSERAASHEHFIDLCRLIEHPTPASDPTGADYCFEKPVHPAAAASKGSKGEYGFVDVWKRGHFAWEYKRKGKYKDLTEAYRQLYQYRDDLDNPPLSIVCDISTTIIHTHFTNYPKREIIIKLEEIPSRLHELRRAFTAPDSFRPEKTTAKVTEDLANEFGDLANNLIDRYPIDDLHLWETAGSPVAHFLMKIMFCLFAEDVGLLPPKLFTNLVNECLFDPESFQPRCAELFEKMRKGGYFGPHKIRFFNGGLFDTAPPLALLHGHLTRLRPLCEAGWHGVEPSIFGTLFERILDPKKRAQIGAHYTSKSDILLVIEPVVMTPLRRKWQALQDELQPIVTSAIAETNKKKRDLLTAPARIKLDEFRRSLHDLSILDPACGSGNFLYVALQQLLDLDDEIVRFGKRFDVNLDPNPYIRPTQLHGLEINPYAAELAQVVIWIGYLQWLFIHVLEPRDTPILPKLNTIENRDAILDLSPSRKADGAAVGKPKLATPAQWPKADFIIGNPPFLGSKLFRASGLSDQYLHALYSAYDLPKTSDLCCYWFELARNAIEANPTTRAGLLATQGIRGGDNRTVLERIKEKGDIFEAWSHKEWYLDGAAVDISIVCFDSGREHGRRLDGQLALSINADIRTGADIGSARALSENQRIAFMGDTKGGAFDIDVALASTIARSPNAAGKSNADVIRPWVNGLDFTRRPRAMFIIDFGCDMPATEAAKYEAPFRHLEEQVKPERVKNRRESYAKRWWIHVEPRPAMRKRLPEKRFIVTPNLTKYRLFAWVSGDVLPDHQLIAFARSDDYFFGVLQSTVHELWALRKGTFLEDRPRYTPSTTFETFPLPWPPNHEDTSHPAYKRIASAASELNRLRENWLNPPEWIDPIAQRIDAADDFSDVPKEARPLLRHSAIMAAAAQDSRLKKRTLTNLYNQRPTWLKNAHETLDRAVLAAYAATDPATHPTGGLASASPIWSEDFAPVWTDTGAGAPLPPTHPLHARRLEVDRLILENLLRLNHARSASAPSSLPSPTAPKKSKPQSKRANLS